MYQAPTTNAGAFAALQTAASDDASQVVSVSLGICEPLLDPSGTGKGSVAGAENSIFEEMAAQGQTAVVASGDSGSEGCWQQKGYSNGLAVDDPRKPSPT